jgi:xanthine dehydrogenase accessory factor
VKAHPQWLPWLVQSLQRHGQAVRVVIAAVRGSAPREAGASMIVAAESVHGTIGGGRLEWEVLAQARALLSEGGPQVRLCKFVLGPELGQCCGGAVEVWLELHPRSDVQWLDQVWQRSRCEPLEVCSTLSASGVSETSVSESNGVQHCVTRAVRQRWQTLPHACLQRGDDGAVTLVQLLDRAPSLYLYGAGHVGRAVLRIAAELPWQVTCIDSRAEFLSAACPDSVQMHGVQMLAAPEPVATVVAATAGSCFLVMTHSHALDYALVRAILARATASQDVSWVGLIGSHSKSARFRAQLRRDGIAAAQVERLVCPIGLGLRDKQPMAIAVSVVAQLLQHLQATASAAPSALHPALHCGACVPSCSQCALSAVSS